MTNRSDPVSSAVGRYRALLRAFPARYRAEVADELCQVFEDEYRDAIHRGRSSRAAFWMRVALDTSISVPVVWWGCLRAEGRGAMMGVLGDVRAACKGLARRPGFTLAVTLTLGLGIGATTTILSVVDGVMIRPLPYEDAGRLVAVGTTDPARESAGAALIELERLSVPGYQAFRGRSRSVAALAALEPTSVFLTDVGDGPEEVPSARVSPELFDVLGVAPELGRTFLPEEHRGDAEGAVMISYGAWQRRYGGDPDVVGRAAPRFNQPTVIVGVLPRAFRPPEAFFSEGASPEFWLPFQPDHGRYRNNWPALWAIGRLAPGASVEQAQQEATDIASALAAESPDPIGRPDGSRMGLGVNPLRDQTVGAAGGALGIFLGAAALLLVLACLNAATLFLARLLDRTGELGVRAALGGGGLRIIRLLIVEASVLACAAGALGVLVAYGGVALFLRYAPSSIPSLQSVGVDGRALTATAVLSLGGGLVAGLLPVLRLLRRPPWERLGSGTRATEPLSRLRPLLVGGQMAVAVVLLSGASLLFASFTRIRSAEPGFRPDGLVTLGVGIEGALRSSPPGAINTVSDAWDLALAGIAAVPGVDAVAGATSVPFQPPSWAPRLLLEDDAPGTWRDGIAGYAVTPDYFATLGIPLVSGRTFDGSDLYDTEAVAVVNEAFVRTQLGGRAALGAVLRRSDSLLETELRVVGVVGDVVQARVEDGPRPAIYVPHTQFRGALQAIVRTPLSPDAIARDVRRAVASFNPIEPVRDMTTMRDRMGATRASPRFQAVLIASFAVVAVLLAAAGLYGSLTHWVGRRRRELGLRMAVGADRGTVRRMVLGQGLLVACSGLAIGIIGALGSGRVLAGFLYGVEPGDPRVLAGAVAALVLVAAAASIVPARRATAVDPVRVLNSE